MLIRYGYRITIGSDQPLPLVTLMTARPERRLDLRAPEVFRQMSDHIDAVTPAVVRALTLESLG